MDVFIAGFALGLSLILPIGAQNAFVLRQGLKGQHVFAVAFTCAASDAVLITLGVFGFASLMNSFPSLTDIMRYGGAAFLFAYGIKSLIAAFRVSEGLNPMDDKTASLMATLATCLAMTWLNPHVYLDTIVLLGSIAAQYGEQIQMFWAGAIIASIVFFFSLGYGASWLRPLFVKPAAWRILDGAIAIIMFTIAVQLLRMETPV